MKGIGIIGGMIPGVILFAILRISLDWGLTITPLGTLFFQLLPDIILGGILLGLMSSSVLSSIWSRLLFLPLTTLCPCSSASPAKRASYSKAPATRPYPFNPSLFAFEKVWVYRGM